jgi:hypothetical protein
MLTDCWENTRNSDNIYQTEADKTKKYKFTHKTIVSKFILDSCKQWAREEARMTDDPAVKIAVDHLERMDVPTVRVPDQTRTGEIAMHITPLPSNIPTEATSLPSVCQLESIPAICPYFQMCLDGVDLIPPEQRAVITAGSSSKKKKRAAPHADNVNTKRHCNECYLHFLGKTHPSLEGNYRCPVTYKSQSDWRETRLPTCSIELLPRKKPLLCF